MEVIYFSIFILHPPLHHSRGNEGEGDKEEDRTKLEALRAQIQKLKNDEVSLEEHTAQLQGVLKQMAEDEECKR